MRNKISQVVVFDLDETLGHFSQLGSFCDILEEYNKKLSFKEFCKIMDLFFEFIRPNLFKVLTYLKAKKQKGICNKVLIYTNNQGPKEWAQNIQKYFDKKLNYKLFDQIIAAYRINGELIENKRTTHDKTITDLLNCANLPKNSKICFLDDLYHPKMDNDDVYYINVEPYTNYISPEIFAERYYKLNSTKIQDKKKFNNFVINNMNKYRYKPHYKSDNEKEKDIEITREILYHLRNFFKINKNSKTRKLKNKYTYNNITLKR